MLHLDVDVALRPPNVVIEQPRGRTLIILFTDGRDNTSALDTSHLKAVAERTRALVHLVTRQQVRALADAIQQPPRQWTADELWAAYEKVERGRVRGASQGRLWTDIVSLARHALRPEEDLVPFADRVGERFARWMAQQQNRGRSFSEEQQRWLTLIRDRIASDAEVALDDVDDVPFTNEGGLGRFHALFGDDYATLVQELNAELVA